MNGTVTFGELEIAQSLYDLVNDEVINKWNKWDQSSINLSSRDNVYFSRPVL